MPSRESRRNKSRKVEKTENPVEKKRSRHPFLYIFSVIILVIIVVTFVGGPVIDQVQGTNRFVFGSYAGKPIEYVPGNYFARQRDLIADQVRQYNQSENQNMDVLAYQVWRGAFDQTVIHLSVLREAERAGLWVSEDRVDRTLIQSGPYVVDGKFSETVYRNTSAAERYAVRRLTRDQVTHEQVLRDLFTGQLQSDQEAEFFAVMGADERRFNFISFPFTDYPVEEVGAFGEDNREKFRKVQLSRILVTGEGEAREIRKKLSDRTSTFDELARAHSQDTYAERGGEMGWRYYYDLTQDFENPETVDSFFSLGEGEISEVLDSRFGRVIYRVDQPAVSLDLQDEDALQVVRGYIMRYERGRVEDYFMDRAQELSTAARENGFLEAATAEGLTVNTTRYFPVNYRNVFQLKPVEAEGEVASIAAAAYSEEFFRRAFALEQGEVSEPVSLDDQILVLQLRDRRELPRDERDFLKDYFRYYAGQNLQNDLQNTLVNPDLLEDNFNTVFYQTIYGPG